MTTKTALVTGATSGIGYHVARALAAGGADVIVTGRDADAGSRAVATVERETGRSLRFVQCDHSSLEDNRRLAQWLAQHFKQLDVLVNNVGGVAARDRQATPEGFEVTLATNTLGPRVLTEALLPRLRRSGAAQVVNVVSSAFRLWHRDPFEDVQSEAGYAPMDAYARAKLLTLLLTLVWARTPSADGIRVNAVAPPLAWTPNIARLTPDMVPHLKWWPILRLLQRWHRAATAATTIVAIASAAAPGISGAYFGDRPRAHGAEPLPEALLSHALQDRVWSGIDALIRSPALIPRP